MIDFHSHFLPSIDDGAKNIEMSLKMLEESRKMGVTDIVSTSHCYAYSSDEIETFIEERNAAYKKLIGAAEEKGQELPRIYLGSEVHLTCDISEMRAIHKLCIEGTDYMLLEMPSTPWSDGVIECVYKMSLKGITPIIAHMERNLGQKPELLNQLYNLDILVQINAESFGFGPLKKYIDNMMKSKMIHIIGTDMHNIENRKPNIEKAHKYITKRYGGECWDYLMHNAESVLKENSLPFRNLKSFKKKGLF
ncbi:MAG: tyrosine-protein phosphatase [Candidatus Ornithomonoglobus sp.]